ncbi:MAG: tRNA (adenosine(37)-N6)-threonylcarbamoyltransferase complex dimerization subunit type 1 TsaB [Bacteroidales bacterium]
MSLILNIETATGVCSVALARDGKLLCIKESNIKNSHAEVLTKFIDEVIKTEGIFLNELDAIAVSEGPGSYTGLRIGVAAAKGLCFGLDKPLIGVSTLGVMAVGMVNSYSSYQKANILYCPMIDARRMEVYCAIFTEDGKEVREIRAEIIEENSFHEFFGKNKVIFAGDGAMKCRPLLEKNPNAFFLDYFKTSAKFMIEISEKKFSEKRFENLAYYEPYYLKDFIAGKPRVKGLK